MFDDDKTPPRCVAGRKVNTRSGRAGESLVDHVHRAELGRLPDDAEREHWLRFVEQRSHRAPDTFWMRAVLTAAVRATPEHQVKLAQRGASADDLVDAACRVLLGAPPDASRREGWLTLARSLLADGCPLEVARARVVAAVVAPVPLPPASNEDDATAVRGFVEEARRARASDDEDRPLGRARRVLPRAHRDVPRRVAPLLMLAQNRADTDENEDFLLLSRFHRRE